MKKILLIDREVNSVNSITMFCAALGIETVVVHNWPSQVKSLNPKELSVIFVNVDMLSVHIDKLFESFEQGKKESVPIVFLYSRTYDPRFVKAKEFPYFAEIKKPIPLNEVFLILNRIIDINALSSRNSSSYVRLQEYKKLYTDISDWVETLGVIINKQVSDAN